MMENQVDIENDGGGMIEEEKFDLERNFSTISETGSIREPLLKSKSRVNNTSQIAIVGANVYPIESLDYEYVLLIIFFYSFHLYSATTNSMIKYFLQYCRK